MLTRDGRLTFVDPDRAPAPRAKPSLQPDRAAYAWGTTGKPNVVVLDDGSRDD